MDVSGIAEGTAGGLGSLFGGVAGSLPTILFWVLLLMFVIITGGGVYVGKKYHLWPLTKYPFRVEYFSPRGSLYVPTFNDKFAIVSEGDEQFLLTQRERLVMPYEYLEYMLGDKLFLRCHNRIEIFPFYNKWRVLDKDKKEVTAAEFVGTDKYEEILSDAPRERYLARLRKSKDKYVNESLMQKIAPWTGWIIVVLFSFLLLTALAEQLTLQYNVQASIAETNKETMEYIYRLQSGESLPEDPDTTSRPW